MGRSTIKEITFFKVPFDNSYRNVYTFPSGKQTGSNINQEFVTYFPNTVWNISVTHPVVLKDTNGKIILSATYNVIDIKDYNYCSIKYHKITQDGESDYWKFYFITGYSSMNQGINPTTELSLEYDCWLNNLQDILSDTEKHTMVKGHIKDIDYLAGIGSTVVPKQIMSSAPDVKTTFTIYNQKRRHMILWVKLTLGVKKLFVANVDGTSFTYSEETVYSVLPADSQLPVVYFPLAVFDTGTRLYETAQYKIRVHNPNETVDLLIPNFNLSLDNSGVIFNAELTFYPPFNYYLLDDTNIFEVDKDESLQIKEYFVKEDVNFPLVRAFITADTGLASVISATNKVRTPRQLYFVEQIKLPMINGFDYLDGVLPQKYQYPFYYYEIEINGEKRKIIPPESTTDIEVIISILGESVVYYIDYYNISKTRIFREKPVPIYVMGSIPVEANPESVFYRNQGNQFLAQQDAISTRYNVASSKNMINGAIGIGTAVAGIGAKSPAMVMRGVSSIIDSGMSQYSASTEKNIQNQMFEAKIEDLSNMASSLNFMSNNGLVSLLFQNALMIYEHTAVENSSYTNVFREIYRYGVSTNIVDSLQEIPHNIFNYKQYLDFFAPYIKNLNERNVVEAILYNGVTIWNFVLSSDTAKVRKAKLEMITYNQPNTCKEV